MKKKKKERKIVLLAKRPLRIQNSPRVQVPPRKKNPVPPRLQDPLAQVLSIAPSIIKRIVADAATSKGEGDERETVWLLSSRFKVAWQREKWEGKMVKGKNLTKEKPRGIIRVQVRDSWKGWIAKIFFQTSLNYSRARAVPLDADRIFSKELIIGKVTPPWPGGGRVERTSLEDGINSWFARKRLESSRPEVFYRVNQYRSSLRSAWSLS